VSVVLRDNILTTGAVSNTLIFVSFGVSLSSVVLQSPYWSLV
jgi:hypothetical protein